MTPDSPTELTLTRNLHFGDAVTKEEALRQSRFLGEQIGYYLNEKFRDRPDCVLTTALSSEADSEHTLRKGSAILTVKITFGLNTSYAKRPPRKFYTFTATATQRNEVLDRTEVVTDSIESLSAFVGGLVLGIVLAAVLVLVGGHLALHLIVGGFVFGASVGAYVGRLVGQTIYRKMEQRLEQKGEITAVEQEWQMLAETLAIVFDEAAGASAAG